MLLIRCPYCEQDRPEVEFSYAHQAHKPRPEAADGDLDDHNWARWVYFQKNIKGVAQERWNHAAGCRRSGMPVRSFLAAIHQRPLVIMWRVPITCCRPPARPGFRPVLVWWIS